MVRIKEADLESAINYTMLRGDMEKIWDVTKDDRNIHMAMGPDVIQREKDRARRAQLNSAHGVTAETHDQFYRDHKLVLVLFRALAVMPILRSSPGTFILSSYGGYLCFALLC